MVPLTLVLFGSDKAGSAAAGGAVWAGCLVTSAFHPLRARLVDRRGAPALAGFVACFAAALVALAGLGSLGAAPAILVICAALAGACSPPLGPFTRAAAGAELRARPDVLQRAYALDSAAEEASLVLGPLLVALVTAFWTISAALLVTAGLTFVGGLATARSSFARRIGGHRAAAGSHARLPGRVWLVVASLAATGVTLGAIDVGVPAITRAAGSAAAAGLLLAAMAVGTALAGLLVGLIQWKRPPLERVARVYLGLALALAGCALVRPLPGLAAALMLAGAFVGALFVTAYVAIHALSPAGTATRAFAWIVTANNGGLALGAALAGAIADGNPHGALGLAAVAALAATVPAAAAASADRATRRRASCRSR
ncbi:MAG TPA: hypothetical protein VH418_08095 [Solirubrobacteraceae bacterium]|jgi:MFS family permease